MKQLFKIQNFVPELQPLLADHSFDENAQLQVGLACLKIDESETIVCRSCNRNDVLITDGDKTWTWHVASLSSLFRGDNEPPGPVAYDGVYMDSLLLLEWHVLALSDAIGDRFDHEMQDVYSHLRRRPDGQSTGFTHDFMWQVAAFVLGTRPLSQPEFEAIMLRLERSCRTFATAPASKNYVRHLRELFDAEDEY